VSTAEAAKAPSMGGDFAVGALVRARGREWVVLPDSSRDFLLLRPLGGNEDEVAGVIPALEQVQPAAFALPDPNDLNQIGDHRSCRLLRDAVRLGFRSSAGPFRSFGAIAVEPRPYQLVPLLMALKLDPVRLLIADDVGIGKTIEAGLVARELLDRGEIRRLAVLCPPPLAEQWQAELRDKFHLDAELVLPSTAGRLERNCRMDQSVFDVYPYTVVSTDFIKADRRRDEFLRTCPEFVIVDEAHTCAWGGVGRGLRHQRYRLVSDIAAKADRHMVLVTATPHSGNEEAFRSLLSFLDPGFAALPADLTGRQHERERRRLAQHFVQRRRADIRSYLEAETVFPRREEREESYRLSPEYKKLFTRALAYARETVVDQSGGAHRQRVRWWSALALLRSLASSPAAAAATLRARADTADTQTADEADAIGRRAVMDLMDAESAEGADVVPGTYAEEESAALDEGTSAGEADAHAAASAPSTQRRRLLDMAREADALAGAKDKKLARAVKLVKELVADGHRPILFCRFIPTATYVADELRRKLPKDVEVAAVTGELAAAEREARVAALGEHEKRVLVCTDCLSEGINLQDHFDAVFHYDLSWNPTRHEQREGRVDRYGQPRDVIRVLTYYGTDNQIDGIVLDVLIRKHQRIRSSLGISVPVPVDTEQVVEALLEGLILRGDQGGHSEQLQFEQLVEMEMQGLHQEWDDVTEREKRSRTMFAQSAIKVDEVAEVLRETRAAVGSGVDVARFVREGLAAHNAVLSEAKGSLAGGRTLSCDLGGVPRALRDTMGLGEKTTFRAGFELPVGDGELYLSRTHPVVEGLATYVMDTALDPQAEGAARRMGVIRSGAIAKRTTALLVRFRYHIHAGRGIGEGPLLAEDCAVLAFSGAPTAAEWLDADAAEALLQLKPDANVSPDQAREALSRITVDFDAVRPHLDAVAEGRAAELAESHRRVREAARAGGKAARVEPQLPPDVLGLYVYLPSAGGRA
jgi:ERCC4-related helicase